MLCYGCKQDKEPAEFYPDRSKPARDGLSGYCKVCTHWNTALRRYGVGRKEGARLLAASDGTCPICGQQGVRLYIDHDHKSGALRALICRRCNNALGFMEAFISDPAWADALKQYLGQHNLV